MLDRSGYTIDSFVQYMTFPVEACHMYQCLVSNTISVVLLCRCKAGVETQTQSIRLLIFSTAQGSGYENILLDACRTTAAFRITSGWCSGAFGFMLKPQGLLMESMRAWKMNDIPRKFMLRRQRKQEVMSKK